MQTEIYLIRHGVTRWNREKRIQGHRDEPLSPEGGEQAARLGTYLEEIAFEAVYASDLSRAIQTAEQITRSREMEVRTLSAIRERNLGEWEGLRIEEVKERYPDEWETVWHRGGRYGVEKAEETRKRMMAALEELVETHPGERIAVVSHGGSINAVLEVISGGVHGPGRTRIRNTAISRLIHHPERGWRVEEVNRAEHLEPEGVRSGS
ncbi:putative phosphoglycerate mutase/uncharacterized phosphatase [Melghirimyces profundicolus]|uniref:Putative phosphoglycerate mutase/uncharacterized phosphatase n=1 Tax=Melghirimyces profundicolus TaxID=1242148 RepID=A0A2T6AZB5_9BACL|nr:histidine phosphatase family protein [Melghirimyces profundicolus]PTX49155.1 putative phosphoglycerate mutase/uncharacterized phosphatase [Melghirimyces profundicolus]